MTTTEYLTKDHENIGKLLLVLDSRLARARGGGEEPDVWLMQAIADYAIDYVERHHLPVEQLVLARLEHHGVWPRSLVEARASELRDLRLTMARFSGLLARACVDPEYDRDELARAGRAFVATFRRRLVFENAELLPAAHSALEPNDWRSIEASIRTTGVREDPAEDERFEAMFAELTAFAGCDCEYA